MTSPVTPFKWPEVAQFVYDEYLSKPYTSKTLQDDWAFTHAGVTVPRPNHGLAHTLRTASYVSLVVQAYNVFNKPPLSSTDADHIQLALLFYVTGRENEASFGHPEYPRFRQKSADAFEKYIRKNLPHQFTDDQIRFYRNGIIDPYSSSPPHYVVIRICHDLDLLRCYPIADYLKKINEASRHVETLANPLAELAQECLRATGDRIVGQQNYNGPLFTLCSTNVAESLAKIFSAFQLKQGAIMQAVHSSSSIPPGLKAPIPKTPWNISPDLFARVQSQPEGPFIQCEVLPTDPEAAFVQQYFMHSKPHNYAIRKIYCIHNPDQTLSFEAGVKIIEREAENPINTPKGKEEAPQKERALVISRWQKTTASFSPVKIKGPKRTDKYTEVKVLPLWHGSTPEKCTSICKSGFTSFGKHHHFSAAAKEGVNGSTDIGYFGSGIYFTNSARYAAMYSNGHLLMAWVSMREPYPVVNDAPFPNKGSDMRKLAGQGHYQNYNAHYIPVASIKPHDPKCMEFYPCYQGQVPAWDEIVVFNNNQTVPRFWVELALDSPEHPFKSAYVEPVPVATVVPMLQKKKEPAPPAVVAAPPKPQPVQAAQPIKAPALPLAPFGAAEWNKYFGNVGAEPPLPPNIHQILSAPCPFVKGKKVHESHLLVLVPQTVNGQPLTLKTLGELVQNPHNGGKATKYSYFNIGEYKDPAAPPSHWVLMTRDVIEGSRNKRYKNQQTLVSQKGHASYEVPHILDATVCIFMEHIRSGTRLYGDSPWTYTRCQEKYDATWQLCVGGFAPGGLRVDDDGCDYVFLGVGGSRKF